MKAQKHLEISRNGSHTFYYTLEDENGDPINLGTPTILMTVKARRKDSTAIFTKAGAVVVAVDGTFKVIVTPTETAVPAGSYFYDVIVTISSEKYTAARGRITIHPNII